MRLYYLWNSEKSHSLFLCRENLNKNCNFIGFIMTVSTSSNNRIPNQAYSLTYPLDILPRVSNDSENTKAVSSSIQVDPKIEYTATNIAHTTATSSQQRNPAYSIVAADVDFDWNRIIYAIGKWAMSKRFERKATELNDRVSRLQNRLGNSVANAGIFTKVFVVGSIIYNVHGL